MLNFTFYNPTKICFGKGQIAKLSQEIPEVDILPGLKAGDSYGAHGRH